jgi:hypothetical protein
MSCDEETHKKLVTFLSGEFAREKGRQIILLELVHAPQPGSQGTPLQTWDREERPELFEGMSQIETIASSILRLAEEYARDLPGGRRFEVRTRQHLGGRMRTSFKIESDDEALATIGEDAPTERGLVSQLMRHLEMNQRTLTMVFQSSLGSVSRIAADLAEENRQLRTERNKQFLEIEDHRSMQAERDLALMEKNALVQRKDKAFGEIIKLLPIVASRFATGGGSSTGASVALAALLGELFNSLTDDQKAKLTTVLTPSQAMLLGEALRVAQQSSKSEESSSAS